MEPALEILNRALRGEAGARSFLERTSSIYVLDVTDPSKPKTYGCWNFIHQAMNEVERFEASYAQETSAPESAGLVGHVRLLATMALRVARRGPASDKALIRTCIANAEHFHGTAGQAQWLIDLNLELREIVMGRIAAMAFDFSFHRRTPGPQGLSAFADPVVMDSFCAILSANAVSSGPGAIRHFATEWIIPSSRNIPAFALASVVLHLAAEGARGSAPAGTRDTLQQLSQQTVSIVLVPTLADAIMENAASLENSSSRHEVSAQIAAMCVKAITAWCNATDMSLPQIRHTCNKANINAASAINDAMYSDSPLVVDALAELLESLVLQARDKPVTEERMRQVRYILGVDEISFESRFSPDQLMTIEAKEMESIVEELVSAIGLQRFRFVERQQSGHHDVCRNLVRMASAICLTCLSPSSEGDGIFAKPDTGMIELLQRGAAHPLVNVSAIALEALSPATRKGYSGADGLLPVLQRRAIIPHYIQQGGDLSLSAYDLCGVTFHEFDNFRSVVLTEALRVCWEIDGLRYMDSCTAAVEEFCSAPPSPELSLQLEAALFCMDVVLLNVLDTPKPIRHSKQLHQCFVSLQRRPLALFSNPLTLSRMCHFIQRLSPWLVEEGLIEGAADLVVSALQQGLEQSAANTNHIVLETGVSCVSAASSALKSICRSSPKHFTHEKSLARLSDVWETCCSSQTMRALNLTDRLGLCEGTCCILAALPDDDKQLTAFESMTSRVLFMLEDSVGKARDSESDSTISYLADSIKLLAALPRTFADACSSNTDLMESGCDTSPDKHAEIPESLIKIFQRGWPSLELASENYSHFESVASSLCSMVSDMLPRHPITENRENFLNDLIALMHKMITPKRGSPQLHLMFVAMVDIVHTYGEQIEQIIVSKGHTKSMSDGKKDFGTILEELILAAVAAGRETLGSEWTSPKEQGQGQPAFESKPSPVRRSESMSNESLVGVFELLSICIDSCPNFLLLLPAGPGVDREEDMLIRRGLDSAVASLTDFDPAISRNAMIFLKKAMGKVSHRNTEMGSFLSETLSRACAHMIKLLLMGSCGRFQYQLVEPAGDLLAAIMREAPAADTEGYIRSALQEDFFGLGNEAKNTTLTLLGRVTNKVLNPCDLVGFLQEVWQLHQAEDNEALPGSEAVARFIKTYS